MAYDLPMRTPRLRRVPSLAFSVLLLATASADASAAPRPAPWSVIRSAMHRTYELGPSGDPRFGSVGRRTVASDGRGGSLTAIVGLRRPSADGKGELVFFFHNRRFLGWDARRTSISIYPPRAAGSRRFSIRYVHYARTDALCCPSLRPVTIHYRWTGSRMLGSRRPPNLGSRVRLRRR